MKTVSIFVNRNKGVVDLHRAWRWLGGSLLAICLCSAALAAPPAPRAVPPAPAPVPTGPLPQPGAQPPAAEAPGHSVLQPFAERPDRPGWGPLGMLSGRKDLLTVAREALGNSDPAVRQRGAFVLGAIESPGERDRLRAALKDRDRQVRLVAGVSLCRLGDKQAVGTAREALIQSDPWLRYYAIYSLWVVGGERARSAVAAAKKAQQPFLAGIISQAMKDWSAPRPQPLEQSGWVLDPQEPADLTAWQKIADTYVVGSDFWWHTGNYEQVIRCNQTSLFFDPLLVHAYEDIAYLQWSLGRSGQAVSTLRRGIHNNPQSWDIAQELGTLYMRLHRSYESLTYLRLAAKLGSPPVQRRQLGHLLEQVGRYQEAMQVWQDILKLDPHDPIALRQVQRLKQRGIKE